RSPALLKARLAASSPFCDSDRKEKHRMRKTWFVLFLFALMAPSMINFSASSADSGKTSATEFSPWQSSITGLPNYDIRHELAEIQQLSASNAPDFKARTDAIESFRANIAS